MRSWRWGSGDSKAERPIMKADDHHIDADSKVERVEAWHLHEGEGAMRHAKVHLSAIASSERNAKHRENDGEVRCTPFIVLHRC